MREPLGIQPTFGECPAIVRNLATKQVPLFRHPVPVRVKSDVGDGWVESSDFLRMYQRNQPPLKEVLPIQPQLAREAAKPLVFSSQVFVGPAGRRRAIVSEITLDERWRAMLGAGDTKTFELIAGHLNRAHGYTD